MVAPLADWIFLSDMGCLSLLSAPGGSRGGYRRRYGEPFRGTSGGLPISGDSLRVGELVATLALAQDNAFGQPLESQLRSCLLAVWLAEEAGLDSDSCDTVYWVALLRYIGCTGHAHEVATLFGDEIAIRAQTLIHDAGNPEEVMADVVAFATAGKTHDEREQIIQMIDAGAHEWAVHNFQSGCEAGDMLLQRLDFGPAVRDALAHTFERWNGKGFPNHTGGTDIPLAMRIVHISHDMEAIGRHFSPGRALEAIVDRRDRTYAPDLADLFALHGLDWFKRLEALDPWQSVLDLEPKPLCLLADDELDSALAVAADFIDLKSPYMAGHSRRCADLAAEAATLLGLDAGEVQTIRRAALVHEFGTTAIPNSIWDKPGELTRSERDRVELHPLITEQMLRRSDALAALNPVAACHHERCDGSGYHKRLSAPAIIDGAHVLAAADVFVGLTADRADRRAWSEAEAVAELRRLTSAHCLQQYAVDAVVAAIGVGDPKKLRRQNPAGLTKREVEVLRLAARGLTTQQIADELFISPKTTDHHIQHVYTKIGVSTRAAAALWAMQNGIVS